MIESAAESRANGAGRRADATTVSRRSLDDLASLSHEALGAIYATGTTPARRQALDGDLCGRMLTVRRLERGAVGRFIAALAKSDGFPWGGKSFHATSDAEGTGINRVAIWGRHRLFPFRTYVAGSVVDGRPAVFIDYDNDDNPSLIRSIHDEVREIEPGLFLGPACWKRSGACPVVVLWFALDARGDAGC